MTFLVGVRNNLGVAVALLIHGGLPRVFFFFYCWLMIQMNNLSVVTALFFELPALLLATQSMIWLSWFLGAWLWCKYYHAALFPNLPHSSKHLCVRISNGYFRRRGEKEGWSYRELPPQPLRCFAHLCKRGFWVLFLIFSQKSWWFQMARCHTPVGFLIGLFQHSLPIFLIGG